MKKLISLISFVIVLVMLTGGVSGTVWLVDEDAEPRENQYKSGEFFYSLSQEGEATINLYLGKSTDVTVPSKIDGHPVAGIESYYDEEDAYFGNDHRQVFGPSVKSVVISDGVKFIGEFAFSGCDRLTSVILPKSLTTIKSDAFNGCYSLAEITLPDKLESIYGWAFTSCKSLTQVEIPESVKYLGGSVFSGCTSLTSVGLPDSLLRIGSGLFDNTPIYDDPSNWEDGVMYLDNYLICSDRNAVSGSRAVRGGTRLMANGAFAQNKELTEVVIPDSVVSIGADAFNGCSSLERVVLPAGLTEIGADSFRECVSLKEVNIPDGIKTIGDAAFLRCGSLSDIAIPYGVTRIGSHAFGSCSGIKEFDIPGSVTEIGHRAFYGCSSLLNVSVPNGVSSIGYGTFNNCSSLRTVTIGGTVTTVFSEAFNNCPSLEKVIFKGTKKEWDKIKIEQFNDPLLEADKSFVGFCDFSDVNKKDFFALAVLWAVDMDITKGTSGTRFSPALPCTRGQVVTFLWRAAGEPEPKTATNKFKDVKKSDYFYKAVLWAVENGVTKGMTDTSFSPALPCTRGQVVTFLWRAAGKPGVKGAKNPFSDVKNGDYFYEATLWAVTNGVTKGTTGKTFSPGASCTRGQVVTFLWRNSK